MDLRLSVTRHLSDGLGLKRISSFSPQLHTVCYFKVSNEKRAPSCLSYIGDEILPSYIMGIIIQ